MFRLDDDLTDGTKQSGENALALLRLVLILFLAQFVAVQVVDYFDVAKDYAVHSIVDGLVMIIVAGPALYLFVVRDFIHRLRSQARVMKDQDHLFRCMVETSTDLFWLTRPGRGEMLYVSPSCSMISGLEGETVRKDPLALLDLVVPEDRAEMRRLLTSAGNGESWSYTCRILRRDGEVRWIRNIAHPVRDTDGSIVYLVGTATDVTDLRLQTEELHKALLQSETANIAKNHFLANMSHELRTPLNAVIGFADLGEHLGASKMADMQLEYLGYIRQSGQQLLEIINDILEMSRLESGQVDLQLRILDAVEATSEILENHRKQAEGKKVSLELTAPPAMDVRANPSALRRIIASLISNAIKYNREGGVVMISWGRTEAGQPLLRVRDTGIGIPPDRRHLLFHPFERLGQEHSGISGTGLGLALTRKLAEGMGAVLRYEPDSAGGSVFSVSFPAPDDNRPVYPPFARLRLHREGPVARSSQSSSASGPGSGPGSNGLH